MTAPAASALYTGWVRHRRHAPVPHAFRYRVCQLYLDLDELDSVLPDSRLWSVSRPSAVWFRRVDHLGDPRVPLAAAVRDLVETRTGARPTGPICLLTHPRYFGYVMNPVSFYYCFCAAGARVETIVAEVHNTPWGERHCYVLDASRDEGRGRLKRYRFDKRFHVSPFVPMAIDYDWRFVEPGERLAVHMRNLEAGRVSFDASLSLVREPLTAASLRGALVRYPWMTATVVGAIYWQALRLWLKRAPHYDHPRRSSAEGRAS